MNSSLPPPEFQSRVDLCVATGACQPVGPRGLSLRVPVGEQLTVRIVDEHCSQRKRPGSALPCPVASFVMRLSGPSLLVPRVRAVVGTAGRYEANVALADSGLYSLDIRLDFTDDRGFCACDPTPHRDMVYAILFRHLLHSTPVTIEVTPGPNTSPRPGATSSSFAVAVGSSSLEPVGRWLLVNCSAVTRHPWAAQVTRGEGRTGDRAWGDADATTRLGHHTIPEGFLRDDAVGNRTGSSTSWSGPLSTAMGHRSRRRTSSAFMREACSGGVRAQLLTRAAPGELTLLWVRFSGRQRVLPTGFMRRRAGYQGRGAQPPIPRTRQNGIFLSSLNFPVYALPAATGAPPLEVLSRLVSKLDNASMTGALRGGAAASRQGYYATG